MLLVKAMPANTGIMYVGRHSDGTISATTGYPLSAGDQVPFENVDNLAQIMVDASVSGEIVAWLRISTVR